MCHVSSLLYFVSCVLCHVSCVMCHMACAMCHVTGSDCPSIMFTPPVPQAGLLLWLEGKQKNHLIFFNNLNISPNKQILSDNKKKIGFCICALHLVRKRKKIKLISDQAKTKIKWHNKKIIDWWNRIYKLSYPTKCSKLAVRILKKKKKYLLRRYY